VRPGSPKPSAPGTAPLTPPKLGTQPLDTLKLSDAAKPSGQPNLSDLIAQLQAIKTEAPEPQGDNTNLPELLDEMSNLPIETVFTPFDASAVTPAPKQQWTMAVNLSTTMALTGKDGMAMGAEGKSVQLKALAAQTEGKPVTIVAQAVSEGPQGHQIERFVVKDGKVEAIGSTPSKGYAADLQDLVTLAAKGHPAEHIGLINESHGNAIDGVSGNAGTASLGEIREAIQRGLAAGGVEKLDVLDFDACLMGQGEVLESLQGITDHMIASSEVEWSIGSGMDKQVDAQPTQEMLGALLSNPDMDGGAFADMAIAKAKTNQTRQDVDRDGVADSEEMKNGTVTLAHLDMRGFGAFNAKVDALGDALAVASANPRSRAAIQDLIKAAPRFAGSSNEALSVGAQQRDLKAFATGLQEAIAKGKLSDPAGRLAAAAKDVLDELPNVVTAYHGQAGEEGYDKMGGMGVFLPSQDFFKKPSNLMDSFAKRAQDLAQVMGDPNRPSEEKQQAYDAFCDKFEDTIQNNPFIAAAPRSAVDPLKTAYDVIARGTDAAQIVKAAKAMQKLAENPSNALRKLADVEVQKTHAQTVRDVYANALVGPQGTGWNKFLDTLRAK
jgi:hypothetical protein